LFVDCVVQSGSNPAIMLVKELVETEQITGAKATWALAAIGYFAKTPTRELLHELIVRFYWIKSINVHRLIHQFILSFRTC
jgi:hypothetical protein